VNELKKKGIYENTIIMFCSDNGPSFGGVGVDGPYFNSGGPFKCETGWGKGSLHEGGMREPFIVEWPGKAKAGSTSDMVSATIDIMPTVCELLNINPPKNIDGISILPEILGNQQQQHDYLYWEYPEYGGQLAVRMGNWKGIILNIVKEGNMQWQLFDLDNDIQEQHDVAAQHPDIIKKMEAIAKKEHRTPEVSTFLMPALEEKYNR
jgi:arylsulfatase